MSDQGRRPSGRVQPTGPTQHAPELKFSKHTDEYGSIALLHDPESEHAWIQSTHWTTAER